MSAVARLQHRLPALSARGCIRRNPGHRDFQDAAAFLAAGGERGPQLGFLRPGTYYVNPLMFDVAIQSVAEVERGFVAVIVSNVGLDPTVDPPDAQALTGDAAPVGRRTTSTRKSSIRSRSSPKTASR